MLTSRPVAIVDALPTGSRIASFEIEAVIARGPRSFVYLARDLTRGMPVAIKEFASARRVGASPNQPTEPTDPLVQRGLQAFMAEARMLADCHHPSLVRVEALLDANGTAYRVMPFYKGLSLVHVRTGLGRAPDDATLRAWRSDLLGALQAMHDTGHAHGGVSPENIMLLADDRPLLFGAGSASHRVRSDLVESLLADFGLGGAASAPGEPDPQLLRAAASGAVPDHEPATNAAPVEAVADDMRALAAVLRFCISGKPASGSLVPGAATLTFGSASASSPPHPHQTAPPAPPAQIAAVAPPETAALPLPSRLFAEHVPATGPVTAVDTALSTDIPRAPEPTLDPWLSAPASAIGRGLAPRPFIPERWHIPMWVGLIALLGVAVLAVMSYVMGAWNRMPPIDFDRSLQTAPINAPADAAANALSAVPAASQRSGAGAAPVLRNRAEMDQNTSEPTAPASAASDALPPTSALLTDARDAAAAGPHAAVKAAVQAVDTKPARPMSKNAPRKAPHMQRAQPVAAAKAITPLGACGARTNFALERCMQMQCQNKRWAKHPQCTSRRAA